MSDQIPMPEAARKYLETEMIGVQINGITIKEILGSGTTAITYGGEDNYGAPWALKLVTQESYGGHAPLREVARFAPISDKRFLVFPEDIGEWELLDPSVKFLWFKARCVRGQTLEKFLKSDVAFSSKGEISRFIENIAVALDQLHAAGFAHGDLHARNIMREVIGEGGLLPEIRYVIIDFSEAHPVEQTEIGLHKDLESFGTHLRTFSEAIYRKDVVSREDERVLKAVEHIPGLVQGITAETISLWKPSEVLKRFEDGLRAAEDAPSKLSTPFDSLSAENITNDTLLTALCFTEYPWVKKLKSFDNVLLVGPRGCGKSMIFRRLRLKTKIGAGSMEEIDSDPYVAFYLPCESLFFNRFSDLTEATVERNRDALVLFFNMAVVAEIASTLSVTPDSLGPVNARTAESLKVLLKDELEDVWDKLRLPSDVVSVSDVAEHAERVMRFIRRSIAYGQAVTARGSLDFVSRVVSCVKHKLPLLQSRVFIFLLDDYTEERVPLALQKILHPIICQRARNFCFKISSHMFGSIYSFPQPLALDEGRNIIVVNLGSEYLNRQKKKADKQAVTQIMNSRFKQCEGYEATLQAWLGKTAYTSGNNLNRALHDPTIRDKVKYHGIDCLLDLCTGDISEVIRIVGEIFREAGIEASSPAETIDPAIQDRAIRNVSREFLARVRHIRPDGQKLYDIVNQFGRLSQTLLYERALVGQGKDNRGKRREDPYDLLTMKVDPIV